MRQWRDAKARHPDALLFFRVGDFYELFHDDAEEGARLLGLTLTSRNNGAASSVPLAGVPAKALEDYLGRLVRLGRRVAICDQVEDPAEAKGIVKREVTETLTPGTVVADHLLAERTSTVLAAVVPDGPVGYGVATADVSTGEVTARYVGVAELAAELARLEPSELLISREAEDDARLDAAAGSLPRTVRADWMFEDGAAREALERAYRVQSLDGLGFQEDDGVLLRSVGALVTYLKEVRPAGLGHLRPVRIERPGRIMPLDEMTRRNLELTEPLRPQEARGDARVREPTLLAVLDRAVTAMGGRLLRRWILEPLVDAPEIWRRQEAVGALVEATDLRVRLRETLRDMGDLERLAGKLGTGRVAPRDLVALRRSLGTLPALGALPPADGPELLRELAGGLDPMQDLHELLARAIADEAPATLAEGGVIRSGWSEPLDEMRRVRDGARDFIASLQVRERERTGIGSLKVGYNQVFGYYLEVTRANVDRVPSHYVRKQTLSNGERYYTPELKEWEEKVVAAEDGIGRLEAELFARIRDQLAAAVGRMQDAASRVARLDVLGALAEVAARNAYVRPEVHTGFALEIRGGRHPVVETMMARADFIPNDLVLDDERRVVILTGPNMAGKSTVLRQVGLIQLLAQMGSWVPADRARLPVADRVYTRVGASDNLARGQSTFMVEMSETASILHSATERSLILLDEIGRGTSTYDGVSIAWAVTEHIHERIGAKTIFATHYHELTQLGDLLAGVKNMNVSVREVGDEIVFLRRLADGGADRSYGIHVARLAGMPTGIVARARELLAELEGTHSGGGEGLGRHGRHRPSSEAHPDQLSFFHVEHPLVRRLRALDPDDLTPKEALRLIYELGSLSRPGESP
ncbi:MAG: DNA mismatch repair protein MutS [Gemmatimonadales bacterium]